MTRGRHSARPPRRSWIQARSYGPWTRRLLLHERDPWILGGACALFGMVLTPFLVAWVGPMWSAVAATGIAVSAGIATWLAARRRY